MMPLSKIALVLFALSSQEQNGLSKYKWKNRILIFSTPSLEYPDYTAQLKSFTENQKKLDDRNLILFTLCKGRIYDSALKSVSKIDVVDIRKKYDFPASFSGIMLIGKDGSAKLKRGFPVEPKLIFETIDKMPMRQNEMRENTDDY